MSFMEGPPCSPEKIKIILGNRYSITQKNRADNGFV